MAWLLAAKAFVGKVPTWVKWMVGAILLLGAFWLMLKAYGNSRYEAGAMAEKAAWEAADARLRAKDVEASAEANARENARQRARDAIVEEERQRINEAIERGESPFDSMDGFGNSVVRGT